MTVKKARWLLGKIYPSIGNRPISEISAPELLFALPVIEVTVSALSDHTLNAALRRLGYAMDQMTAHDFRALAATLLNEMGILNPDAIERQLAHADGNSIREHMPAGSIGPSGRG